MEKEGAFLDIDRILAASEPADLKLTTAMYTMGWLRRHRSAEQQADEDSNDGEEGDGGDQAGDERISREDVAAQVQVRAPYWFARPLVRAKCAHLMFPWYFNDDFYDKIMTQLLAPDMKVVTPYLYEIALDIPFTREHAKSVRTRALEILAARHMPICGLVWDQGTEGGEDQEKRLIAAERAGLRRMKEERGAKSSWSAALEQARFSPYRVPDYLAPRDPALDG
eukprot:Hpha_TRINITY_DN15803_c5_g2::TRINITY_DN15803_c5_g2_i1::g.189902::m.189902